MATFSIDRQNDQEALRYRAAADGFYARAGVARKLELLIVVASVVIGVFAAGDASLQFDAAFWSLILAVVDATVLYRTIVINRHMAAMLSECFDRYVFSDASHIQLPCSPSIDEVAVMAETRLSNPKAASSLQDWYDARIGRFSRGRAHLAALRINAFWDTSLRGAYIFGLVFVAVVIAIVGSYLFARNGFALDRLVTNVLVPFAPAILWFGRELVDQIEARSRKDAFRQCVHDLWDRGARPGGDPTLSQELEFLQALLFAYRRADVSIPGWLYSMRRDSLHKDVATFMERLLDQGKGKE